MENPQGFSKVALTKQWLIHVVTSWLYSFIFFKYL